MKKRWFLVVILAFVILEFQAQVSHVKSRDYITLKDWSFKKGIYNGAQKFDYKTTDWEQVKIPHTYSMDAINELGYYRGEAWYRKPVKIPKSMEGNRVFIRFEGVGHDVQLYINEKRMGKHSGGYSAFCFDITDHLDFEKENLIALKVSNASNFKRIPVNDKLFNLYGGVYRPVQIFSTPNTYISTTHFASSGVFVETKTVNNNVAELEVRTHLKATIPSSATLTYELFDATGNLLITKDRQINDVHNVKIAKETLSVSNPNLWQARENPYLYSLKVTLKTENSTDSVTEDFGIRTFSVSPDKGFILNKKPYRLYGVAMHQEWQQHGPALQENNHRTDMSLVNEIGATALRLSHYQHSDLTYKLADSLGLVVWSEIPYVHDWSGREGGNAKQQLKELIFQNYNHPSVCFWGLWNEVRSWAGKNTPAVKLTEELQKIAKTEDSSRITVSASDKKMDSPMSRISDLQAFNKYYGWYYGKESDLGTWLDETHEKYPQDALAISEYGVGGNIYHQEVSKLQKPSGAYFPEQVQTMYHEASWKILKDRPFVWGSFIWNMFDFSVAGWNRGGISNLNHKGLVSFDRKTKKDAFYFYKSNWSDDSVLYIAERRNISRFQSENTIKVFTNLPSVTLWINGKKVKREKLASDLNTITFENVLLKEGTNRIKVTSKHAIFSDEVEWNVKAE